MVRLLKVAGIAIIGGTIFHLIGMPLAWLLGSLTAVAIADYFGVKLGQLPSSLHKIGLLLLGYTLGSNFVPDLFRALLLHIPAMLISTVTIIFICVLIAKWMAKTTGEELASFLIGSMPGGLSQMILLGDELKADVNIVTLMQVIRIVCVVFIMPLVALGLAQYSTLPLSTPVTEAVDRSGLETGLILLFFFLISLVFGWLASKINMPTPYLMGPILGTILVIICGLQAPAMPSPLFMLSQLLIGSRFGLQVDIRRIIALKKVALFTFLGTLLLMLTSFGMSYLIQNIYEVSLLSAFLGTVPGGMVEMGITASEVQEDVLLVTGYQMFRVFFLLLVVPPLLKWSLKNWVKKKNSPYNQEQAM